LKKFLLRLFLLFVVLQTSELSYAVTCNSTANGNWANGAIWSCGRKPGCGDTIYISHTVTVAATEDYTACGSPMFIIINATGTLHYNMGRKLRLPCGSGLSILTGGQMTAASYSGANNQLEICGVEVWRASDGPQAGPLVFGSGLPIELLSFEANRKNENVKVDWVTASETNNDYFTLERSENGYEFEPISILDGAGTSNVPLSYSQIDYNVSSSGLYYRLKQTDYDGAFTYSQIKYIEPIESLEGFLLYPNPTDGTIHIVFNDFSEETVLIEIRDITGRICSQFSFTPSSKNHSQSYDLKNVLAAGTYIITTSSGNKLYTQKLVVK
jgi:hypothetical protein